VHACGLGRHRGGEDARAQRRGRIDLWHRDGEPAGDDGQLTHFARAVAARRQMRLERMPLGIAHSAERVGAGQLPELVVRHGWPRPPRASLSFNSPVRMRVFTVPSGCCSRAAMSLCDSPS
jgi:hypothetical protein